MKHISIRRTSEELLVIPIVWTLGIRNFTFESLLKFMLTFLFQQKKKLGLDYILGNKWIILGIIAVILIILIIVIVGATVARRHKASNEAVSSTVPDPVAYNVQCGEAVGIWEQNLTVAVFKVIVGYNLNGFNLHVY